MSKLLSLKQWVAVGEAARRLSIVCGESVTEADILRLALDGQLTLSVHLTIEVHAKLAEKSLLQPESRYMAISLEPGIRLVDIKLKNERGFSDNKSNQESILAATDDRVTSLNGVFDLPMIGSERLFVENKCRQLLNEQLLDATDGAYVCVMGADCQLYVLQEMDDAPIVFDGDDKTTVGEFTKQIAKNHYHDARKLPQDSMLVIRTDALREFEQAIGDSTAKADRPISARERNTLLVIIAALAKEAKIDLSKPSKAGEAIANLTQRIGTPVDHSTIEQKIKQIAAALESRAT